VTEAASSGLELANCQEWLGYGLREDGTRIQDMTMLQAKENYDVAIVYSTAVARATALRTTNQSTPNSSSYS
jgi:hypothetical protein